MHRWCAHECAFSSQAHTSVAQWSTELQRTRYTLWRRPYCMTRATLLSRVWALRSRADGADWRAVPDDSDSCDDECDSALGIGVTLSGAPRQKKRRLTAPQITSLVDARDAGVTGKKVHTHHRMAVAAECGLPESAVRNWMNNHVSHTPPSVRNTHTPKGRGRPEREIPFAHGVRANATASFDTRLSRISCFHFHLIPRTTNRCVLVGMHERGTRMAPPCGGALRSPCVEWRSPSQARYDAREVGLIACEEECTRMYVWHARGLENN
jgi:hypothetical protein